MGSHVIAAGPAARLIERPRLLTRLDSAELDGVRALCLVAPAGYGKTVLAEQWARSRHPGAIWHYATEASADLTYIARSIARELDPRSPGIARRVADRLSGGAASDAVVDDVVELLAEAWPKGEGWLVVDDAHLLEAEQSAGLVASLAEREICRVLLTSRRRPPLATPRGILYGQVVVVGREALELDDEELAQITAGRTLDDAARRAVGRWPVLVSLGLDGAPRTPIRNRLELFGFIAEDVLASLSPCTRRALLALALCRSIDERSARELVGPDGSTALQEADAAGLLTLAGDGSARLHPLVGDFLVQQFLLLDPQERVPLAERAFALALRARDWDDAFFVATRAQRPDLVARTIRRGYRALLNEGRHATLVRWREQLAGGSALATLVDAELALSRGDLHSAEGLGATSAQAATQPWIRARAFYVAGLGAFLACRFDSARRYYEDAAATARTPAGQADALWGIFMCESTCGTAEAAAGLLQRYRSVVPPSPTATVRYAAGALKIETIALGWTDFLEDAAVAANVIDGVQDPRIRASFWTGYGDTLVDLGRRYEAERALAALSDEVRRSGLAFAEGRMRMLEAKYEILVRRFARAHAALEKARELEEADPTVRVGVACYRLFLAISSDDLFGRPDDVLTRDISSGHVAYDSYLLACRALYAAARGDAEEAEALAAVPAEDPRSAQVRTMARLALGMASAREETLLRGVRAATTTRHAFALAIALRGRPEAIPRLVADAELAPFVLDTLAIADSALAKRYGVTLPGTETLAGLSEREAEVIALLAEGLTNRQIARRLFIAESTAKLHVRRILAKTGTRSREEAALLLGA
jgi:DNA-binding NarL/FixJ family response regulator